jgi:glycosyltransferase involved in cell wall biosynthesis
VTRIVHATDVYWPSIGGLERSVASLAARQVADGHDVLIVTPRVDGHPNKEVIDGLVIRRLPQFISRLPVHQSADRPYCPPFADPELQRGLDRLFSSWRPDIVHTHGLIVYSALEPAHRSGAALVAGVHDYSFVCAKKTLFRGTAICPGPRLSRCLPCATEHFGLKGVVAVGSLFARSARLRDADARIAVSSAVARRGSSPRQSVNGGVQVVPTFIDDAELERVTLAPPPPWAPAGPFILYAGALTNTKGTDVLLDAFRIVREQDPDVTLVLAALLTDIDPVPLLPEGVRIVKNASHEEVLGGWRSATIGVHPAVWGEPCSLAIIECLAAGTPMVATEVGGNPDLLDFGRAGVLVSPGEPEELADALIALLGDADRRARLGSLGRARAQRFGLDAVLPQLERVYEEALSRRGTGVPQ